MDESSVVVNSGRYLLSFCSGYGSVSESHVSVESKVLYDDLTFTMWLMFAVLRLASPQPKVARVQVRNAPTRETRWPAVLMLIC